jgi:molybdopterin converting factor subunit 1
VKIVYFASLRRQLGIAEEVVAPPPDIETVGQLLAWLGERSQTHLQALAGQSRLMVAINQDYAGLESRVAAGDEIAFFPPVTGG